MTASLAISVLAERLRHSSGIAAKSDIASVAKSLGLSGDDVIPVGDDCAAIPDGDSYLLFAIEGFKNEFVAGDPWFAGWCGAMVNISDIAAMGAEPGEAYLSVVLPPSLSDEDAVAVHRGAEALAVECGVTIAGGDLARDRAAGLDVKLLGALHRRRQGVAVGEHEPRHAIGQRRLADALRAAKQPGVRNASAAIGVQQRHLGIAMTEPRAGFARMRCCDVLLDLAGAHAR